MVTFYLLNQPESTWMKEGRWEGAADTSLTKRGKAHATKVARYYSTRQIDGIISSRLHRAIQGAKILNQFIPGKITRDERLNNMNLGIWQGKFPEEVEARYPEQYSLWLTNPELAEIPDGGNILDSKIAVESFIKQYCTDELFPKFYIVNTHDIITRIFLSVITDKPLSKMWEYTLTPASITTVEIYPEKRIVEINNLEHLY
jgi:broad specificity phosphatase PhoE